MSREYLQQRRERNATTIRFAELLTGRMEAQYDDRGQRLPPHKDAEVDA